APGPAAAADAAYEEGLARLKIRAFEKLEVDKRLEKLTEEVEQKIASQVGRLQVELDRKSSELEKAKQESLRLSREKQELEDRASELSRQVDVSVEMLASLKQDLVQKEQELTRKQQPDLTPQEFGQIWRGPGERAAPGPGGGRARSLRRLQPALLLQHRVSECPSVPAALGFHRENPRERKSQRTGKGRAPRRALSSAIPAPRASSRAKAVSQSSGCYDSDSAEPCPTDDTAEGAPEGKEGRGPRRRDGHRAPLTRSCPRSPVATDAGCPTARPEGAGAKVCRLERGSPGHCGEVISPEILKMRAALFCIFTYLDTKTLLRAAEVCKDWKFVARHPAVWTRVLLENARVSSKFLAMLSQWCTQMHSLTLQNLKPRQRGKKESKEDYMKSTRGCLEAGLEALLKATGSNLLILRISHCPNVLTDRSLWLASCYCRALQAVTYRSSTDPVGHEVIWALGAGCRDIISLQVAPLHPCQQPTRFSNRCLQMIGRCWPHLRALGVGGAGCGVQGLASLARNCMRLQVLELDHVAEINQEVAAEVCREGLKGLEMLVLTSTPVTPKALLHFNSVCRNLKSIVVQVGIVDYFKEPHSPEARKMFEEMVNKLQALRKRPGFSKILHIKVEGGC
ncbi:FBX41 protein, partial [Aegithalos caudatus]|nr:FBX41 protein [Aegithalos caudatus]